MKKSKLPDWITFIGIVLLLLGVYASIRTVINMTLFEKYPTEGVISLNFSGQAPYSQKESDCTYPQLYYMPDGRTTRPPSADEISVQKEQQQNCLASVAQARQNAKNNDIAQSLMFLFLGTGILVSRKIFFK
jgi:hypothetical protein